MNIIEAIKSGKNFRRKDGDWFLPFLDRRDIDISDITYDDILADDWEIEENTKASIQADEFFDKRPNVYKFLVDNGVSVEIADDAQEMVSKFAASLANFLEEKLSKISK